MIYDGALAANGVIPVANWFLAAIIGVLIILWILIGLTNLGKLNTVAMTALFILSLINGSQESGIATASSTAAPKVRLPSSTIAGMAPFPIEGEYTNE